MILYRQYYMVSLKKLTKMSILELEKLLMKNPHNLNSGHRNSIFVVVVVFLLFFVFVFAYAKGKW